MAFTRALVEEKSENRKPKSERSPKSEIRTDQPLFKLLEFNSEPQRHQGKEFSDFGLRVSFGFRISDFGFSSQPSDKPKSYDLISPSYCTNAWKKRSCE